MVKLTVTVCDECGKEARRLVEIDHGMYCSRECYLSVCKRLFDSTWLQTLKSRERGKILPKSKLRVSNVA